MQSQNPVNGNVHFLGTLGWIGLGHMGSRIAKRLIRAGYPLMVYDRDGAKAKEFESQGAQFAASPADLAAGADVIFSCLSNGTAIQSVYYGRDGALRNAKPGSYIVEMSTVAPETSLHLFQAGNERGIPVLDVAISGSTPAAESGSLTLFGGGDRKAFDFVAPVFPAIAHQWFYMGPSRSGVAMKLVVNTLLGVGMQAIAEALALGGRMGLPRQLLFDTLGKTAVVAPAHLGKLETAKRNDYATQFPLRLMQKDFHLILSKSAELGVPMPATLAAAETTMAEAAFGHEEDYSAVVRLTEEFSEKDRSTPPAALDTPDVLLHEAALEEVPIKVGAAGKSSIPART
jgi:3-hydroxyisobutyrate dehydrogenase-like beta-hydroxyacid dehydrogenase